MLTVEVTLLTGRYVATAFDDRGKAEWPPHPARFFSALAATHFESLERSPGERAVLEWLEEQGAPEISASDSSKRDVVTVFVPVNDTSVLADLDGPASKVAETRADVEAARSEGGKKLAMAEKKLAKSSEAFADAARKAVAVLPPGKEGKAEPGTAASLIPEQRGKQPRTFPSVTPLTPRVVFAWPGADPTSEQRITLDGLAARVVRLGHSSSLVSVRVLDGVSADGATWVPDATGELCDPEHERTLRVVEPGQMNALDAMPRGQADEPGRVMPATFQRYVRPWTQSLEKAPTTIFGQDWIVLRRVGGPRLPTVRVIDVARTVRKALLAAYGDDAPEILSGHASPGEPSSHPHVAIVPLPFVGHDRADGSILGVAIILPSGATPADRGAVRTAFAAWCRANLRDGEPRVPVHLGAAGDLVLAPVDERVTLTSLRPTTWCQRATTWATATPIALDRNPGDLRSTDPAKAAAAFSNAEETIALACERVGLPRPARVTTMVAAPFAGGEKVRHFPPFNAGKVQRVLLHSRVHFDRPVEGPILLGAGRFFGLGLLRPVGHV